jgi:hypothetical protein
VHRHRKPARPFRKVTSHGLEWQFLKRPCLAGPLFSLAVPGSQSDIRSWLAVIFTTKRKGKKSSGTGSSCMGYCETSFLRERG